MVFLLAFSNGGMWQAITKSSQFLEIILLFVSFLEHMKYVAYDNFVNLVNHHVEEGLTYDGTVMHHCTITEVHHMMDLD